MYTGGSLVNSSIADWAVSSSLYRMRAYLKTTRDISAIFIAGKKWQLPWASVKSISAFCCVCLLLTDASAYQSLRPDTVRQLLLTFRGIDSLVGTIYVCTIIHKSQPNSLITLMFKLSHAYDCSLDVTADCHIKIRKNWVPASSDEGLVMTPKRQD